MRFAQQHNTMAKNADAIQPWDYTVLYSMQESQLHLLGVIQHAKLYSMHTWLDMQSIQVGHSGYTATPQTLEHRHELEATLLQVGKAWEINPPENAPKFPWQTFKFFAFTKFKTCPMRW